MTSTNPPSFIDTLIVGAGFGGLCMAIKLREAGHTDLLILEKGREVGGTWRDNQYPGAACDVQSHLYSFSFAPKLDWPLRYSGWQDIYSYTLDVTERYQLRPSIRFNREVTGAQFDEASARWTVSTAQGETWSCRYLVLASGPLHVPAIPDIPGLASFQGKLMHSARWDKSYDLTGKRVASIGSGGSAIQYVPEIAPKVAKLHVFQRSAAWVVPRDTRHYSTFSQTLFKWLPWTRVLHRWGLYWWNESRVWPFLLPPVARLLQRVVAWRMRRQVRDKATADALIPDYTLGCKRVLISNVWLPTFNRPNVELVTKPIKEIREHSIVTADGQEREVDCLILGTGFQVDPRLYMKGFTLTGRKDHDIHRDWAKLPTAYLGISVAGYPNLFQLVGPHTALGHNSIIFMIEAQVNYVLRCMDYVRARGADWLDVTPAAQQKFTQWTQDQLKTTVWNSGCQSWYQTADGINFTLWPGSTWKYWLRCRNVVADDYEFGKQ